MNKLDFIRPRKPNALNVFSLLSSKPGKHKFRFTRFWPTSNGTAVRDGSGWYIAKPIVKNEPKKYNWVFKRGKLCNEIINKYAVKIMAKKNEKRA